MPAAIWPHSCFIQPTFYLHPVLTSHCILLPGSCCRQNQINSFVTSTRAWKWVAGPVVQLEKNPLRYFTLSYLWILNEWQLKFSKDLEFGCPGNSYEYSEWDLWNQACWFDAFEVCVTQLNENTICSCWCARQEAAVTLRARLPVGAVLRRSWGYFPFLKRSSRAEEVRSKIHSLCRAKCECWARQISLDSLVFTFLDLHICP